MRVKHLAQKNKMGKSNTANSATSWVPFVFAQKDLDKAQADGLISDDDQVIFSSTERIPKPRSGFRVMFFAFLLHGLSLPAHEFLRGLLFVCGVQLHQLTPNSILHIACFVTLCESFLGIEPHFLLWKYLMVFFLQRRVQPLQHRLSKMWMFSGLGDYSRVSEDLMEFSMAASVQVRALTTLTKDHEIAELAANYFDSKHPLAAVCTFLVYPFSSFLLLVAVSSFLDFLAI
jgi:hypothetical protein